MPPEANVRMRMPFLGDRVSRRSREARGISRSSDVSEQIHIRTRLPTTVSSDEDWPVDRRLPSTSRGFVAVVRALSRSRTGIRPLPNTLSRRGQPRDGADRRARSAAPRPGSPRQPAARDRHRAARGPKPPPRKSAPPPKKESSPRRGASADVGRSVSGDLHPTVSIALTAESVPSATASSTGRREGRPHDRRVVTPAPVASAADRPLQATVAVPTSRPDVAKITANTLAFTVNVAQKSWVHDRNRRRSNRSPRGDRTRHGTVKTFHGKTASPSCRQRRRGRRDRSNGKDRSVRSAPAGAVVDTTIRFTL